MACETMADSDPAPAAITTVNVKLPLFWPADPEVWFAQVGPGTVCLIIWSKMP